jgi:hypothetical protein
MKAMRRPNRSWQRSDGNLRLQQEEQGGIGSGSGVEAKQLRENESMQVGLLERETAQRIPRL